MAYSIGSSLTKKSKKPLTIIAVASASLRAAAHRVEELLLTDLTDAGFVLDGRALLVDLHRWLRVARRLLVHDERVAANARLGADRTSVHFDQAAIGRLTAVRADALIRHDRRRARRNVNDFRAGVLMLSLAGKGHRENLAACPLAHQINGGVLHRQPRADVAVDPLYRRVGVRDGALGDEVKDVAIPVLDRGISNACPFERYQLDHRRVQRRQSKTSGRCSPRCSVPWRPCRR